MPAGWFSAPMLRGGLKIIGTFFTSLKFIIYGEAYERELGEDRLIGELPDRSQVIQLGGRNL